MRHRIAGVLSEDIPTLEQASEALLIGRVEILADFFISKQRRGYLTGLWDGRPRIEVIQEECRRIGASLVWIHPQAGNDDVQFDVLLQ